MRTTLSDPIQETIVDVMSIDYILEDMPHDWTEETKARLLEVWAPRSSRAIASKLDLDGQRRAVQILRRGAKSPLEQRFTQELQMRSRYAWDFTGERIELLSRLFGRIADGLEVERMPNQL